MWGSSSQRVEHVLEELQQHDDSISQIVSSETSLAVLTTSGVVYQLSLVTQSDSQVLMSVSHICVLIVSPAC